VSHTAMAAGHSWIRRYARPGNRISAAPTEIYSPSSSLRPRYPYNYADTQRSEAVELPSLTVEVPGAWHVCGTAVFAPAT